MRMTTVLALSGSPSVDSRTALVAGYVARRLVDLGHDASLIDIRADLPAEDLIGGRAGAAATRHATAAVAEADALVVATPVYKAAYSGVLKTFLDLLPQGGLAGKVVLPLATGGSLAHLLTIDYALRPVLAALGASHVVAGCFLLDTAIERRPGGLVRLAPQAELRLTAAVDEFLAALPAAALTPAG